jgi:hypothetical protein
MVRSQRGQHGGGGVAADRDGAPAAGVVGQGAADEPAGAGQAFGDALDQAERGRGCAERAGHEAGHQRGGDLVADIGEEARRADAADARG